MLSPAADHAIAAALKHCGGDVGQLISALDAAAALTRDGKPTWPVANFRIEVLMRPANIDRALDAATAPPKKDFGALLDPAARWNPPQYEYPPIDPEYLAAIKKIDEDERNGNGTGGAK